MVFTRLSSVDISILPKASAHACSASATTPLKFQSLISAFRFCRALSTLTADMPTFTIKGLPSLLSNEKTAMLSELFFSSVTGLENSATK